MTETWTREPVEDSATSTGYPVTEQTTGINFRAYNGDLLAQLHLAALVSQLAVLRHRLARVQGRLQRCRKDRPITDVYTSHDTALTVRNGSAVPGHGAHHAVHRARAAGRRSRRLPAGHLDIKRLTVNAGLRWDYLNNKVEAQDAPGGTWIGPRHFDALTDVPNFKDLSPRLGVAYDLFGNGKTAVKATLSRYVADLDGRRRAAAQPAHDLGQQHDAAVDRRRQRRRHPADAGGELGAARARSTDCRSARSTSPPATTRTRFTASASGATTGKCLDQRHAAS